MSERLRQLKTAGSVRDVPVPEPLARVLAEQARYAPCVTLCVCVLDAPMILAGGTPEDPQLTLSPWVRVVRGESLQLQHWIKYQHYVVDFVHRDFLLEFVGRHLLPFADSFADRVVKGEPLVIARKGRVPDAEKWQWDELKPVA